jgi:hypothetical protein
MLYCHSFSISLNLEYTTRKVHETSVRLKLNGTHQLLANANDVNLLGGNTEAIKKHRETLN